MKTGLPRRVINKLISYLNASRLIMMILINLTIFLLMSILITIQTNQIKKVKIQAILGTGLHQRKMLIM